VDYQSNLEVGSLVIEKPPDLGFALSFNETDKVRREDSCYLAVISLYLVEKDSLEQIIGSGSQGIGVGTRIRKRLQPIQFKSESLWLD